MNGRTEPFYQRRNGGNYDTVNTGSVAFDRSAYGCGSESSDKKRRQNG